MLNRVLISVFITVFFYAGVQAQPAEPWKTFASTEGKFSVLIPCSPDITSEEIKNTAGSTKQVYHSCLYGKAAYTMSYSFLPVVADQKLMLDNFRNGIVSGSKSTVISEKEISLSGYPGREFSVKGASEGTELHYDWRIYLVDKRIYSVSFITKTADADPPTALKFLSSFALEK